MNPDSLDDDINDAWDWLQQYTPAERLLILESLNKEIRNGHVEYGDMIRYEALTDWFKHDGWKYANNVPEAVEDDIIEEDEDTSSVEQAVRKKTVKRVIAEYEDRDKDIYPDLQSYILGLMLPAGVDVAKDYADAGDDRIDRFINKRLDDFQEDQRARDHDVDGYIEKLKGETVLLKQKNEENHQRILYLEKHVDAIQTRLNDSNDRIAVLEHTIADLVEKMTFLVASKEAANELDEVEF